MSRKRKYVVRNGNLTTKVFYDSEWAEFIVRLYRAGDLYAPADYFANDLADAIETANHIVKPVSQYVAASTRQDSGFLERFFVPPRGADSSMADIMARCVALSKS